MIGRRIFWRVYILASIASVGISISLFRLFLQVFDSPYEEAAIMAGLLAMPINWLVGEQLTWSTRKNSRWVRAARYFFVYGTGLLINSLIIHWLAHVLAFDARISDIFGISASLAWTGPMNRFWTWAEDVPSRIWQR